jgi:hypothetical protein
MKKYKVDFVEIIPSELFARKDDVFICANSYHEILEMLLPHQYILNIWEQQDGSYVLINIPQTERKRKRLCWEECVK